MSVHLIFLQWRLGGIFECLLFAVCIAAGVLCLYVQVHLCYRGVDGGGVLTLICIWCKTTDV
jgi:hypothetical protein